MRAREEGEEEGLELLVRLRSVGDVHGGEGGCEVCERESGVAAAHRPSRSPVGHKRVQRDDRTMSVLRHLHHTTAEMAEQRQARG